MEKKGISYFVSKAIDGIRIAIAFIIMTPIIFFGSIFIFIYSLLEGVNWQKCKYWKTCAWYDTKSPVCNEDMGHYGEGFAGCYFKNSEIEAKNKAERRRTR
jgi:cellobiose-specific phosphotransferase system component IIC